jgi:hypothetical protein
MTFNYPTIAILVASLLAAAAGVAADIALGRRSARGSRIRTRGADH